MRLRDVLGVPKQRLWVSSGASTAENSQIILKEITLIVKWRFWPGREAEFPFRNVSTLTDAGSGMSLGSRSSQRLGLCHCGATSPGPLKFLNVRLYGYLSLSCRRPFSFLSERSVGVCVRRAGHAAPHSRAARGQASLGTGAGTRQKKAASRRRGAQQLGLLVLLNCRSRVIAPRVTFYEMVNISALFPINPASEPL